MNLMKRGKRPKLKLIKGGQAEPEPADLPAPWTIKGNYELFGTDVMVRMQPVREDTDSLIIRPQQAETRFCVVGMGPDVTRVKADDLVLLSGRVTKVLAKELLAEYVTTLWVGDEPRVIVPEHEIKARVS
jgi:hypothetical protein